jgi:hypothetical protein
MLVMDTDIPIVFSVNVPFSVGFYTKLMILKTFRNEVNSLFKSIIVACLH